MGTFSDIFARVRAAIRGDQGTAIQGKDVSIVEGGKHALPAKVAWLAAVMGVEQWQSFLGTQSD